MRSLLSLVRAPFLSLSPSTISHKQVHLALATYTSSLTAEQTMASRKLLVDIHTHVYLPRYAAFLRSRNTVPRIFTRATPEGQQEERLLILDDEPSGGRPVGAQVHSAIMPLKCLS